MEPAHILEVSTIDLLIQFAETGLGIAGVVRQFVEPELKNGILCQIPLDFDFPDREKMCIRDRLYTKVKSEIRF